MSVLNVGGKVELLREYATRYPSPVFIETGVWNGRGSGMSLLDLPFQQLHFIEADPESVAAAERWRDGLGDEDAARIFLWQGDSARTLPLALRRIRWPALVWLDAHVGEHEQGRSPLLAELAALVAHGLGHVILIDDVRLCGHADWPTLDELEFGLIQAGWDVTVADDVLRAVPR